MDDSKEWIYNDDFVETKSSTHKGGKMKGIILAGGSGTRLHPITRVVNKHLLPVWNKPMIYYPLSTLKNAGIVDILIITTIYDNDTFKNLLGDGSKFGLNISYAVQSLPSGIAEAFIIGKNFIGNDNVTLILGDNIFHGTISDKISQFMQGSIIYTDAIIFTYTVNDPERYGVVKFNDAGGFSGVIEKPTEFVSNKAVVGIYCFPNNVVDKVQELKYSSRGELEITDLINIYYNDGNFSKVYTTHLSSDSNVWLDTGTHEALLEASEYVKAVEHRTGITIGDLNG